MFFALAITTAIIVQYILFADRAGGHVRTGGPDTRPSRHAGHVHVGQRPGRPPNRHALDRRVRHHLQAALTQWLRRQQPGNVIPFEYPSRNKRQTTSITCGEPVIGGRDLRVRKPNADVGDESVPERLVEEPRPVGLT